MKTNFPFRPLYTGVHGNIKKFPDQMQNPVIILHDKINVHLRHSLPTILVILARIL